MRNIAKFLAVLVFLLWLLSPFPFLGESGTYNVITQTIWCSSHFSCLHEIGHKLDYGSGHVSNSENFQMVVSDYLNKENPSQLDNLFIWYILNVPGFKERNIFFLDPWSEVYASIFSFSNADIHNMPNELVGFYDWSVAKELVRIHQKFP